MNSHSSVPETGRHHSVHQEACEVAIFDFQATHGQSVGAPTNVRGVLLPVGFSTGPKSRSTCAWPKAQSGHCLANFGKESAILEASWCPKTYQINRIQCLFSSGQVPSVCQHLSAVGRAPGTGPCMCRPVCARDILGMRKPSCLQAVTVQT